MENQKIVRRFIHSMSWIYLIYYLIPEEIYGYSRKILLVSIIAIILIFEGVRIYKGWKILGMREYEEKNVAAYAWATMGAGIALLFFPIHLAVICLFGLGIVDPIIGELRERNSQLYPYFPFILWFLISLIGYFTLTDIDLVFVILLSSIGAISAIISEYPVILIDDDFLMVVVPIIILRSVEYIIF